jgi:hypothetical protein
LSPAPAITHQSSPNTRRQYEIWQAIAQAPSLSEFANQLHRHRTTIGRVSRPQRREALATIATEFHQRAGTLTAAVSENLNRYRNGALCLRTAHQPNFLPAVNIVAQPLLNNQLGQLLHLAHNSQPDQQPGLKQPPSEVFFLVDYDLDNDRRYRRACLPSPSTQAGVLTIAAPAEQRPSGRLMCDEPPPTPVQLQRLASRLDGWVRCELRAVTAKPRRQALHRMAAGNLHELHQTLVSAAAVARNLADFNSIVLSRIINLHLGLPTLFLPGTAAWRAMSADLAQVWSRREEIRYAAERATRDIWPSSLPVTGTSCCVPFWIRCRCAQRLPIPGNPQRTPKLVVCPGCRRPHCISDSNAPEQIRKGNLFPRVLPDDLLDGQIWGNLAGCDYRGGVEHVAHSMSTAYRLGMRPLPLYMSRRDIAASWQDLTGPHFAPLCQHLPGESTGMAASRELVVSGRVSIALPLIWSQNLVPESLIGHRGSHFVAHQGGRQDSPGLRPPPAVRWSPESRRRRSPRSGSVPTPQADHQ